jgi:hypothetical protein
MMHTATRHQLSFAAFAFEIGAVDVDDLRAAYVTCEARALTLEAVLVERLDALVVSFIRDALSLAERSCERCGGRVARSMNRLDFACRCRCSTPELQVA